MFFLNPKNGVTYNIVAQTPQYQISSLNSLQNIPISSANCKAAGDSGGRRKYLAQQRNGSCDALQHPAHAGHLRSVQGRDLGAVGRDINKIVAKNEKSLIARQLCDECAGRSRR